MKRAYRLPSGICSHRGFSASILRYQSVKKTALVLAVDAGRLHSLAFG